MSLLWRKFVTQKVYPKFQKKQQHETMTKRIYAQVLSQTFYTL